MKNVHNDLEIIEHDPLTRRETVHRDGTDIVIFFQPCLDFVCDRFQLWLGCARTNNEEVCET
jgi:hypothetical protein